VTTRNVIHNLPPQPTPFVGRTTEVAEIAALLADPACRLLTLVGPGGIGKTRLALEVAARPLRDFADGVFFIDLAPLSSPDNIIHSVAHALRFQFYESGDLRQQLLDYLREKCALLVVDNFEHLLEGAPLIADVLNAAPDVKILATSREPLSLREEWIRHVEGMRYPADSRLDDVDSYSAVQLFVECARRIRRGFSLDDEADCVARICQLVEGMPLAIELAATWLRTLAPTDIAREIEQDKDFLATTLRNIPERHRSIRAIFERSWMLLSGEEQAVYRRLSAFRGGFRQDAAEHVAGASLQALAALVDKSLLGRASSGRYGIHDLLQRFAEEKLDQSGEADAICDAHAGYYADFLAQRIADLKGRRQLEALDEIEADLENVRTGWQRAVSRQNTTSIVRAMEAIHLFFYMRTRWQEGHEFFRWTLEHLIPLGVQHPVVNSIAMYSVRMLALHRRPLINVEGMRDQVEQCLRVAQRHGNRHDEALCLYIVGNMLTVITHYADALLFLESGLAVCHELDDKFYAAQTLQVLGICYSQLGRTDNATRQSLDLRREIGDKVGMAGSLINLGARAFMVGHHVEAERHVREGVSIARQMGNWGRVSFGTVSLGFIVFYRGDMEEAHRLGREALDMAAALNILDAKGEALRLLIALAVAEEDYAAARSLCEELQPIDPTSVDMEMAFISCGMADYEAARRHFRTALRVMGAVGAHDAALSYLPTALILLAHEGELEKAIELMAVIANHPIKNADLLFKKYPVMARHRAALEAEVAPAVFAAAWERGQASNVETVMAALLDHFDVARDNLPHAAQPTPDGPAEMVEALSQRELEVLRLTAAGLSNREIAEQLVVGVSTVKKHINHIYDKLGVKSRTQAIARARAMKVIA
jgi:predicted ATPase/DNA-binding CsgD family transcriptional regulator